VGGTLFAGEKEEGTFAYLDMLPGSRWQVWWRKVLTGAVLVIVAVSIFLCVAISGGLIDSRAGLANWLFLAGTLAFISYGWGVLGSVLARSSLAACGVGLAIGTLFGAVLFAFAAGCIELAREAMNLRRYIANDYSAGELAYLGATYSML